MDLHSRIYVAGHKGLVGGAIVRALQARGFQNVITKTRTETDLENQGAVFKMFLEEKPEYVFMAAAKVGGILANNTYPVDFIRSNLMVQNNIIDASHFSRVRKLLFLGSSCIYPKLAPQPIKEEYFLAGPMEKTSEPYAMAKAAGVILCQAYRQPERRRHDLAVALKAGHGLDGFAPGTGGLVVVVGAQRADQPPHRE